MKCLINYREKAKVSILILDASLFSVKNPVYRQNVLSIRRTYKNLIFKVSFADEILNKEHPCLLLHNKDEYN